MAATLIHYVEFYIPVLRPSGRIYTKRRHQTILSRDIKKLDIPQGAFGFKFFDIQMAIENGITMKSDPINISGMHYLGGHIIMAKKAKTVIFDQKLLGKIESGKWLRVILCNDSQFREFKHGDVIVMQYKKIKNKEA